MRRPVALRRLGAAFFAVSIAVSLAACGTSGSATPPGSGNNPGSGSGPGGGGVGSTPQPPIIQNLTRYSGPPVSVAFPTWGSDIAPILEAAIQPQDYISVDVAKGDPALANLVGWSHVFSTGNNTNETSQPPYPERSLQQVALSQCPSTGVLTYNIEHWIFTPQNQQLDPAGAIIQAMHEVHALPTCAGSPSPAFVAGVAPDGIFNGASGSNSCNYTLGSTSAFYNEVANGLSLGNPIGGTTWVNSGPNNNWQGVDLYDTQVQILMSTNPSNLCYGTIANWVQGEEALTNLAKTGNPNIKIWAELSLKDETWDTIASAVAQMQQQTQKPDVYYFSYPRPTAPGQLPSPICPVALPQPPAHSLPACTYETPANLQAQLYYIGRATPAP